MFPCTDLHWEEFGPGSMGDQSYPSPSHLKLEPGLTEAMPEFHDLWITDNRWIYHRWINPTKRHALKGLTGLLKWSACSFQTSHVDLFSRRTAGSISAQWSWDTHLRTESWRRSRWGSWGIRGRPGWSFRPLRIRSWWRWWCCSWTAGAWSSARSREETRCSSCESNLERINRDGLKLPLQIFGEKSTWCCSWTLGL